MTLALELPPGLEAELAAAAARSGLPLRDYVLRVLTEGVKNGHTPRNGAELVAYWQAEGLIGVRTDITDSAAHAREIRKQAERRVRP